MSIVQPNLTQSPESTSKGWILLFYGSESKSGCTRGIFSRNVGLFNFKHSRRNNPFDDLILLTTYTAFYKIMGKMQQQKTKELIQLLEEEIEH
jgi:hypothetical protein